MIYNSVFDNFWKKKKLHTLSQINWGGRAVIIIKSPFPLQEFLGNPLASRP